MNMTNAMTITAKFPGTCTACGGAIQPGAKILWAKGQGSAHVTCPTAAAAPAAKPAPAKRAPAPRAPRPSKAMMEGPTVRNDREPYHVGDVLVVQLTEAEIAACEARQGHAAVNMPAPPTGAKPVPAGRRRVAVVVIHADRMRQDDADDNGYCGRYGATLRIATEAEAAPTLKRWTDAANAKAHAAWCAAWGAIGAAVVRASVADRIAVPSLHYSVDDLRGAVRVAEERGARGITAAWSRLPDGSIVVQTYGHDDYRSTSYVTAAQLLAIAEERADRMPLTASLLHLAQYDREPGQGEYWRRDSMGNELHRARVWLAASRGEPITREPADPSRVLDAATTAEVFADLPGVAS